MNLLDCVKSLIKCNEPVNSKAFILHMSEIDLILGVEDLEHSKYYFCRLDWVTLPVNQKKKSIGNYIHQTIAEIK